MSDCTELLAEWHEARENSELYEERLYDAHDALEDESGWWEPETATTGGAIGGGIVVCASTGFWICLLGLGVAGILALGSEGERQEDIDEAEQDVLQAGTNYQLAMMEEDRIWCELMDCLVEETEAMENIPR